MHYKCLLTYNGIVPPLKVRRTSLRRVMCLPGQGCEVDGVTPTPTTAFKSQFQLWLRAKLSTYTIDSDSDSAAMASPRSRWIFGDSDYESWSGFQNRFRFRLWLQGQNCRLRTTPTLITKSWNLTANKRHKIVGPSNDGHVRRRNRLRNSHHFSGKFLWLSKVCLKKKSTSNYVSVWMFLVKHMNR